VAASAITVVAALTYRNAKTQMYLFCTELLRTSVTEHAYSRVEMRTLVSASLGSSEMC